MTCMKDQCRSPVACEGFGYCRDLNLAPVSEQVAKLDKQAKRIAELEGALRPFSLKATAYECRHPTLRRPVADSTQITHRLGDFRAARAALTAEVKS